MRPRSIARSAFLILFAGLAAAGLAAFAAPASAAGPWDGTYECRDIRPSETIRWTVSAPVGYCNGWVGTITIADGQVRGSVRQVYKPDGNYVTVVTSANVTGRVASSGSFENAILRVGGRNSYKFEGTLAGAQVLNDQRRGWFFRLRDTTQARTQTAARETNAARSPASGSYCYRPERNEMFELRGSACAAGAFQVTSADFRSWRSNKAAFLGTFRARTATTTVAATGNIAAAKAAYNAGDYAKAYAEFLPAARGGDAQAQTYIGVMYYNGRGVAKDEAEAVRWYRKEAASVRGGGWQTTVGRDLAGQTLGVVGLGRLGSQVVRGGGAFGMNVIAWSPNLTAQRATDCGAAFVRVPHQHVAGPAD